MNRDLIITGIPRSGTTLVGTIVSSLDNAICLSEPRWQATWAEEARSKAAYAAQVIRDFTTVRRKLQKGQPVIDRTSEDGKPLTNYFKRLKDGRTVDAFRYAAIERKMTGDFLLAMKHNTPYTCVLAELVRQSRIPVLAVVRHPIPTILSWRSMDIIPIHRGELPTARRFWRKLMKQNRETPDVLLRQVRIYDEFCRTYLKLDKKIRLIRYEDLVKEPGQIPVWLGRKLVKKIPVSNKNRSPHYPFADVELIQSYLRKHGPHVAALYPDLTAF